MRFLLDTHLVLWAATERSQLTQNEYTVLFDPANELLVSAVSIWELRIKWNRRFRSGDRKSPHDPQGVLQAVQRLGIIVEPLTGEQSAIRLEVAPAHNDPFDELLLAVAQHFRAMLFTRDKDLRGHPLAYHAS